MSSPVLFPDYASLLDRLYGLRAVSRSDQSLVVVAQGSRDAHELLPERIATLEAADEGRRIGQGGEQGLRRGNGGTDRRGIRTGEDVELGRHVLVGQLVVGIARWAGIEHREPGERRRIRSSSRERIRSVGREEPGQLGVGGDQIPGCIRWGAALEALVVRLPVAESKGATWFFHLNE